MNGRKAKALRKIAYGDTSLRIKRGYAESNRRYCFNPVSEISGIRRTLTNEPDTPRAIYQKLKRAYKSAA